MEIKFKAAFDFGDEVYMKADTEQLKGIIVSITKNWNGGVTYRIAYAKEEAYDCQACELSVVADPAMIKKKADPDAE